MQPKCQILLHGKRSLLWNWPPNVLHSRLLHRSFIGKHTLKIWGGYLVYSLKYICQNLQIARKTELCGKSRLKFTNVYRIQYFTFICSKCSSFILNSFPDFLYLRIALFLVPYIVLLLFFAFSALLYVAWYMRSSSIRVQSLLQSDPGSTPSSLSMLTIVFVPSLKIPIAKWVANSTVWRPEWVIFGARCQIKPLNDSFWFWVPPCKHETKRDSLLRASKTHLISYATAAGKGLSCLYYDGPKLCDGPKSKPRLSSTLLALSAALASACNVSSFSTITFTNLFPVNFLFFLLMLRNFRFSLEGILATWNLRNTVKIRLPSTSKWPRFHARAFEKGMDREVGSYDLKTRVFFSKILFVTVPLPWKRHLDWE